MSNENAIPPITEPMGRYWDQPEREKILIDDTHAVMKKETFDKLQTYSTSDPSNVYEGKMWKGYVPPKRGETGKGTWYLSWYGPHPNPNKCSFNDRIILLLE